MKTLFLKVFALVLITSMVACKKDVEDLGLRSAYGVYTTMTPTPLEAPTVSTSGSGAQNIPTVYFRVYVSMLYSEDVTVTFTLTGTAVKGTHYNYNGNYTVTIPANTRYVDIPVSIINNSLGTATSRTIILTITAVTNNFTIGIGANLGYTKSTYTITK